MFCLILVSTVVGIGLAATAAAVVLRGGSDSSTDDPRKLAEDTWKRLESDDLDAAKSLFVLQEKPCGIDFGPECPAGKSSGSLVPALAVEGCAEVFMGADQLDLVLNGVAPTGARLFGAYVSAGTVASPDEVTLVAQQPEGRIRRDISMVLLNREGKIARVNFPCKPMTAEAAMGAVDSSKVVIAGPAAD
jgi:hypothetical protein